MSLTHHMIHIVCNLYLPFVACMLYTMCVICMHLHKTLKISKMPQILWCRKRFCTHYMSNMENLLMEMFMMATSRVSFYMLHGCFILLLAKKMAFIVYVVHRSYFVLCRSLSGV